MEKKRGNCNFETGLFLSDFFLTKIFLDDDRLGFIIITTIKHQHNNNSNRDRGTEINSRAHKYNTRMRKDLVRCVMMGRK